MGHSSLLGTDSAPARTPGHDAATLGPGDSSDSGSDMAGLDDELEAADHMVPVDVALRESEVRPGMPGAALDDSGDSAGTGERSSAGLDGGRREAADISADRVFTPGSTDDLDEADPDEDPDLAFIDAAEAGDVLEDEEDDEDEEDGADGADSGNTAGTSRGTGAR